MAKTEPWHFDRDNAYINGFVDAVEMIKKLYSLSIDERLDKFEEHQVPTILDKYDFAQIRERLETLNKYYIIRGIRVNDEGFKKVVAESDKLSLKPDEVLINAFLNYHKNKNVSFAIVEEIFVRE